MPDRSPNPFDDTTPSREWTVALTLGLTILICLAAFVWLFIQLDPFMSDFISGTDSAAPTEELASPTASP